MKWYRWACCVCRKERVFKVHWWKGVIGDTPWGGKLEYNDDPQDEIMHPPQNICRDCVKDALIWAGKQRRR